MADLFPRSCVYFLLQALPLSALYFILATKSCSFAESTDLGQAKDTDRESESLFLSHRGHS